MPLARTVVLWGTGSHAGKSLLVTALARWLARQGVRVAPFKAQNMSNHARVGEGGEMGAAQYYQALAAGVVPHVDMNPVLLKPEAPTRSQVVLRGEAHPGLTRTRWRVRSPYLWPAIQASLKRLRRAYQVVLVEGAGSPAEINLADTDLVNRAVVREAEAQVLLVTDIDRGGSFAHLYGTWSLLPPDLRERLAGFVLNKFRGDPALLAPGPELLERWTGVPTLGAFPYLHHSLPEEDAVRLPPVPAPATEQVWAVVVYPYASNLDEFWPLAHLTRVRWARTSKDLEGADVVVLPGAKNVGRGLEWLWETGMARALREAAARGARVLGVCGGLQMLGEAVHDPSGLEFHGSRRGLGLLPLVTEFRPPKQVRHTQARFGSVAPPWQALSGLEIQGYEIHFGITAAHGPVQRVLPRDLGFQRGPVLGLYLHGLLENPQVQQALFGRTAPALEETFDQLADAVERHLDGERLRHLFGLETPRTLAAASPTRYKRPRLALVLGGARSGKSRWAVAQARRLAGNRVTFIATARPLDPDMEARIRRHREARPSAWETLEAPLEVAQALRKARHPVVVLDCVTVWVANLLLEKGEDAVLPGVEALLAAWRETGKTLLAVSNEVGMGVVPATALGRTYRDLLGQVNQRLMAAAQEAVLLVAGHPLVLKRA